MDFTLVSIILTVLFGIPGYLALKKERATKILFIQQDKINLYDKVVKTFEDLEIRYKGNPIKQSMFLLRGVFVCTGRKDIPKENIVKPISVDLSAHSFWHECRIIKTSKDLHPKGKIVTNELQFEMELIKNEDFLYVEAIGESEDDSFKVSHRIANVPKIKIKSFDDLTTNIKNLAFSSLIFLLGLGFLILNKPYKLDPYVLQERYVSKTDSTILYDSLPLTIKYHSLTNNLKDTTVKKYNYFHFLFHRETPPLELNKDYFIKFSLIDRTGFIALFITLMILSLLLILILYSSILEFFRFRRIYTLIKKNIHIEKT